MKSVPRTGLGAVTQPQLRNGNNLRPADLEIARALKDTLRQAPEAGKPVPAEAAPKAADNGLFRSKEGNLLFPVPLSQLPSGSAPTAPGTAALVDPKRNVYYRVITGGIVGRLTSGPMDLPEGARFNGGPYGVSELVELAKEAAASAQKPRVFDDNGTRWQCLGGNFVL